MVELRKEMRRRWQFEPCLSLAILPAAELVPNVLLCVLLDLLMTRQPRIFIHLAQACILERTLNNCLARQKDAESKHDKRQVILGDHVFVVLQNIGCIQLSRSF